MKNKIIYWTATGLISLMMLMSAFAYFNDPAVSEGFTSMGFPDYFRVELGLAKILGVLVLLLPFSPKFLKEWAYAGFAITFISAFIAHFVNGHPFSAIIMPVVAAALLITSRIYLSKQSA
ncbi:VIT1/CCC1 family predicted Fe2+/Mn2+ transporter [Algoriphagus iocasae]|uniref:VIT1/CCC1 family predicted Fe2+/Mn2+ transporter n=1 Tax=Algoriphagus iocasae TaxID=1836499 RepID=A0A841N045_9BACT|nr:DoxX family protein [Algoriphagus iocasae]MBB6328075.1 VIT1/CCC1 family predicted Fe2+/Mn2+ transporter [Algoriphagus iocasae]